MWIKQLRKTSGQRWQLQGLVGSLDALLVATVYKQTAVTQLCIVHDREEAAYFYSDLKNLLGPDSVLLYPASRQSPYAPVVTDHSDHLMRTEVLQRLQPASTPAPLIVTYPAALTEKVINPKVLADHTWTVQVGDELITTSVTQHLVKQGFKKTDFVYEAGQFAIRGGIIDIFGYACSWPFRLALWGNNVESIRIFDPTSQRSLEVITKATISPYLSVSTVNQSHQSLLTCLSSQSLVWIKDYALVLDTLEKSHAQALKIFQEKTNDFGNQVLP